MKFYRYLRQNYSPRFRKAGFGQFSIKPMKTVTLFLGILSVLILESCGSSRKISKPEITNNTGIESTVIIKNKVPEVLINTKDVAANDVVNFAETLIGIKYKYGSSSKEQGFDCSGFVNYVFNHFKISVPRTSVGFTNAGNEISIKDSKPGDLILFTGSNAKSGIVGHLGLITENKNGNIKFIHASENRGIMISEMNSYFIPRFVKVNRVFTVF